MIAIRNLSLYTLQIQSPTEPGQTESDRSSPASVRMAGLSVPGATDLLPGARRMHIGWLNKLLYEKIDL